MFTFFLPPGILKREIRPCTDMQHFTIVKRLRKQREFADFNWTRHQPPEQEVAPSPGKKISLTSVIVTVIPFYGLIKSFINNSERVKDGCIIYASSQWCQVPSCLLPAPFCWICHSEKRLYGKIQLCFSQCQNQLIHIDHINGRWWYSKARVWFRCRWWHLWCYRVLFTFGLSTLMH